MIHWRRTIGCGLLSGLLLASFSSCEMKNELWGKDPNELSPDESGILDLKPSVKEPVYNGLETETRASNTDKIIVPKVEDLQVKIFNEAQELQDYFESYADYEKESEYMVKAGTYYVEVSTGENYEVTTDYPYYEAIDTCEVRVKEVVTVNAVCQLQSAIVYLIPSDEFLEACLDDYSITITNGSGIISIGKDDPKIVYVRPGMEATVTIRATEKETQTPVIRTFVLADNEGHVHAQDLFRVEIKDLEEDIIPDEPEQPDPEPDPEPEPEPDPEPEEPTTGKFTIKVNMTVNENPVDIVVPSAGGNGGNIGGDGDEGDSGDTGGSESAISITGDAVNTDLVVNAPNGISSFVVQIDSPLLPPDELEGIGLKSEFDLVNPGSMSGALSGLGFPVNIGGETSVSFNISKFVPMLKILGSGTSNFHLTVTDSKGNTQSKTITVTT